MSDSLISQLFDFGALGLFAGFLIWQHLGMQKRLDALVQSFQSQLKEIEVAHETRLEVIRTTNEERIEIMRVRYDEVIERVRKDGAEALAACMAHRDELIGKLGVQIEQLTASVAKANEGLDRLQRQYELEIERRLKGEGN